MLLAVLLLLQATADPAITNNRVPSAIVQELESKLKLPAGASPFARYSRFYTEFDMDGRDTIMGQLVDNRLLDDYYTHSGKPVPGPLTRGLEDVLQPVADGGCTTAVTILYDVQARTLSKVVCNAPGPGGR